MVGVPAKYVLMGASKDPDVYALASVASLGLVTPARAEAVITDMFKFLDYIHVGNCDLVKQVKEVQILNYRKAIVSNKKRTRLNRI